MEIIHAPQKGTKIYRQIFILLLNFSLSVFVSMNKIIAQDSLTRPKVGLALSGGGARGIAHLGVIKVMEEAGLRPDFITGVSMGSVIGGVYSIGYTADSLIKIATNVDWDLLLSNKIPENKVIFQEKSNFNNSIISLPISLKEVKLPSGLINGQQIESFLNFYSWPAADISDFSKLPIPFLCIGSDIITCKQVDLKTGYLPDALRASTAVPSIFTPIKIDTALLIDGGMTRIIAASEVRNLGADIVIGSYTGRRFYREEELQSITGVMVQLGSFTGLFDSEYQKKMVDLLIEPDVENISPTSFKDIDQIIKRGYEAALPFKDRFIKIADSLNGISTQKPLQNILNKKNYKIDKIDISGNKIYSNNLILGILNIKPGESVNKDLLNERIELLYGKAWFEKVKYRIIPGNDSIRLQIECVEKPRAMIYGSVHYDHTLRSGLLIGFSIKNVFLNNSFIDFDAFIGQFYRLKVDITHFIDKEQKYGLSAGLYADNSLLPFLELKGDLGDILSRNMLTGMSLLRILGLNHMMKISVGLKNLNLIPDYVSNIQIQKLSYNYLAESFEYRINTLDKKHFPDRGTLLHLSSEVNKLLSAGIKMDSSITVFNDFHNKDIAFDHFLAVSGNIKHYFSFNNRLTAAFTGDILYMSDPDSISAQNNCFFLGGLESVNWRSVPMIGFHPNEIPVNRIAGFGMELDWEILRDFHLDLTGNLFVIQEAVKDSGYSLLAGYGLGVGYSSIIGPIKAGIMQGFYNQERHFNSLKGYISVGYLF